MKTIHGMMRSWGVGTAAVLLSALPLPAADDDAASASAPPNFLFLGVDDLNDWIEPLGGHPAARTPNIRQLAERGVLFTNAHCAAPACNPSRAALFTGIRPSTSGIYHNSQPWRASDVLRDALTLPQFLREHGGYAVFGSGKMFHDAFADPASWDRYFPSLEKQRPADPLPDGRPLSGIPKMAHFDWGPIDAQAGEMGDAKVADWVCNELARDHEKPFFLACGFYRPHLPWYVPENYFSAVGAAESLHLPDVPQNDLGDIPEAGRRMARPGGDHAKVLAHDQWHEAVRGYLASIAFVDEQVGRVLAALGTSAHRDNTIIIFWTDHGWHLGEKMHWRKFALWEEATRTPVVIAGPGIDAGSCSKPVSLVDLYPTVLELAGVQANSRVEGHSLVPLLRDPGAAEWTRAALTTEGRGNHAVRDERWRYIRYRDGGEELYDHAADPGEFTNLAGDPAHADTIRRLASYLPADDAPDVNRRR